MTPGFAVRFVARSFRNLAVGRPICVSFEVTHACPADCRHCDKGLHPRERERLQPDDYRKLARELTPGVVQLSGGEPLTRPDLEQIAAAVKDGDRPPLLICVTNGWLLTEQRYLALVESGVDLFSVSLDFPDERHDDFRRLPGLYRRLAELVPRLVAEHGRGNVALNTALTRANFAAIPELVARAEEWGVKISFSAYSALRTGDRELCISSPEDLALLRRHFDFLLEHRRGSDTILNSPWILRSTLRFFEAGGHLGGCRAGIRFVVVRPDGMLNGCSMYPDQRFRTLQEVASGFDTRDRCDECFVAIRAGTERSVLRLTVEGLAMWRSFLTGASRGRAAGSARSVRSAAQ